MEKDKHINFRLKKSLYDRLKEEANKRELNVAQLVRIFVHEGLVERCKDLRPLDMGQINRHDSELIEKKERREEIIFKSTVEAVLLCRDILGLMGKEEKERKEYQRKANQLTRQYYSILNIQGEPDEG